MKIVTLLIGLLIFPLCTFAEPEAGMGATAPSENAHVLRGFTENQDELSEIVAVSDQRKRQVMFFMGVPLLLLLLATGALGIAMGVYGKPVFVAHMVCAGLSMTLALAHAVAGVVWFYPF